MLMAQSVGAWTLAELDRLPDDGNKYELVDGDLFVTPAPRPTHQRLEAILIKLLVRYLEATGIGDLYASNTAIRMENSELLPDLSVRRPLNTVPRTNAEMPLPILVVEVLSPTTRRRDHESKRDFYLRNGIPEYWIVDGEDRTIRVIKPNTVDVVATHELTWAPESTTAPLTIDVAKYFLDALLE